MLAMIAIEIHVNGQLAQTLASGDAALLTADLHWLRMQHPSGKTIDEAWLWGRGSGPTGKPVGWPKVSLKLGDVVTLRLVEVDTAPEPGTPWDPADRLRQLEEMPPDAE